MEIRLKQSSSPHIFSISKNGQFLCFFGAKHSTNTEDEQFNEMDLHFEEFARKENKKKVVLIESNKIDIPDSVKDRGKIISVFGERGYAKFLSKQAGVETRFPEQPLNIEYGETLKKYEEKVVSLYYFLRTALSNLRKNPNEPLEKTYEKSLEICNERVFCKQNKQISFGDLQETNRDIFGKDLVQMSEKDISNAISPVYKGTMLNEIAFSVSYERDLRIINAVSGLWKDGYDIFIVFGSHHAKTQEGALRKIL